MVKNKNNQSVWSSRISKKNSSMFERIGSSLSVDKKLFREDIECSIAHIEMLHRQKIISFKIKNKVLFGLNRIKNEIIKKKFHFTNSDEDIHMSIERRLSQIIGEDAGYLQTARSRNDQVVTDLKIWMRKNTTEIIKLLDSTCRIILKKADTNLNTLMSGFTHLKNAQAISLSHYFLAYIEMFNRDKKRLKNNLESLLENPLGVAAFSGTSFNIDRDYTTRKLKFDKPTKNSIDTVSDRDFVIDFLYASSACSIHISRFAEEMIIWNSDAFNLISLSDKIVTGSSIMPQKKNPDALEFLRGQTGNLFGNLFSMLTILKGLPLSYFKDLQDDKRIVFNSFNNLKNSILILNEVLNNMIINKKEMLALSKKGFITATDLADYLVKKLNYPFRKSYNVTAKIVNYCEKNNKTFNNLTLEELRKIEPKLNSDVMKVFDLNNSVKSKISYGGTSFDNVKKMIKHYKKELKK